jgi:hypothetical protein
VLVEIGNTSHGEMHAVIKCLYRKHPSMQEEVRGSYVMGVRTCAQNLQVAVLYYLMSSAVASR